MDIFYAKLTNVLITAAATTIPANNGKTLCKNNVPGWNSVVRFKHQIARAAFLMWVNHNRPKSGFVYINMTESRKDFKYVLRQCRHDAEKHKANGLAAALKKDKTYKTFWHRVNSKNRIASIHCWRCEWWL